MAVEDNDHLTVHVLDSSLVVTISQGDDSDTQNMVNVITSLSSVSPVQAIRKGSDSFS